MAHEGVVFQVEGHALLEMADVFDRICPPIIHHIVRGGTCQATEFAQYLWRKES